MLKEGTQGFAGEEKRSETVLMMTVRWDEEEMDDPSVLRRGSEGLGGGGGLVQLRVNVRLKGRHKEKGQGKRTGEAKGQGRGTLPVGSHYS